MLGLNQVRAGNKIMFRSEPYEVVEANHHKMGRGGAKLVTKLRNLKSQAIIETTFSGDERLDEADISFRAAQFLYLEGAVAYFMQQDDFSQHSIALTETQQKFLKEGDSADLLLWQEQVIGVKLPTKVELTVTYTEPGFKGNTASATLKPATVETGASVQVPLFIKTGDRIRLNTETGAYDSRV